MNKMNKKGTIIHWFIFGIIGALALFFISTSDFLVSPGLRGTWQLNLISQVQEAEIDLLKLDMQAQAATMKTAVYLAEQGGFLSDSPCGQVQGSNLWNKADKFCFPTPPRDITLIFNQQFPGDTFSEVLVDKNIARGKSKSRTLQKELPYLQRYTYAYNFIVFLPYSFEEYITVQQEAARLLAKCRNRADITSCLTENKKEHWQLAPCDAGVAPSLADTRMFPTCVTSKYSKTINYSFALDFSPSEPLAIEEITAWYNYDTLAYEISFPEIPTASGYRIYFTNSDISQFAGNPNNIVVLQGSGDFLGSVVVSHEELQAGEQYCIDVPERQPGAAYLCDNNIIYTFENTLIPEKPYFLTVTSLQGDAESVVASVVRVN